MVASGEPLAPPAPAPPQQGAWRSASTTTAIPEWPARNFKCHDASMADPLDAPPTLERVALEGGWIGWQVRCPWCSDLSVPCLSWVAAWAELARHFGERHRSVQER